MVDDLRSQHELNSKIEALWVSGEQETEVEV